MTIREKFETLVKGLVESKVITESQSSSFEPIIEQFEMLVKESETKAIKAAAQVTESRMAEYDKDVKKQLTETFKQLKRHNEATVKLAKHKAAALAERKIVDAVDAYLNEYVEKLLPESLVVDYDRLQKLEAMQESLKRTLIINDKVIYKTAKKLKEAVEAEIEEEDDSTAKKIKDLEEQVADLLDKKNQLECQAKTDARNKALDEKLKDIPALEAKKVRKYFEAEDATIEEVEQDFDQVLSIVKKALDIAADVEDEEEVPADTADDIDDKISTIVGSEAEEDEIDVEVEEDEDEEEVEEAEDDDEEEVKETEEEDEEEVKTESIRKKSSKKLIKEHSLMSSYINNYQKLNS